MERRVTLIQIEVSGIQSYIFGSNNLRQNIGASERVARTTTEQVVEVLNELLLPGQHNVAWAKETVDYDGRTLATQGLQAEVIYAGGGNALLLFEGGYDGYPRAFVQRITATALEQAPGLTLLADGVEFDWAEMALSERHKTLRAQLARRKAGAPRPTPLLGLGVTPDCDFTGLPAVGRDPDGRLIARGVKQKLALTKKRKGQASAAESRLARILPAEIREQYELVRDFDQFGERDESSYIAVVHTDGNGMHKRFEALVEAHPTASDNAAYASQVRELSQAINRRSEMALGATVQLLHDSRDAKNYFGGVVPVPQRKKKDYLPFRPIVFGGDDTTFVCEGRLGLALTAYYLRQLAQGTLPGSRAGEEGEPLYARAGVAIVKSHYPFSRAYDLAEELAASAKHTLQDEKQGGKGIVLDWHVSTAGAILDLRKIRARDYRATNGFPLLMRPLWLLSIEGNPWNSWRNFDGVGSEFQSDEKWPRNKLMALRTALREGEEAVKAFRTNYNVPKLPSITELNSSVCEQGWDDDLCPYFDPIEATDFYVPLEPRKKGKNE